MGLPCGFALSMVNYLYYYNTVPNYYPPPICTSAIIPHPPLLSRKSLKGAAKVHAALVQQINHLIPQIFVRDIPY